MPTQRDPTWQMRTGCLLAGARALQLTREMQRDFGIGHVRSGFDGVDCLAAHAHAARQAGRAYAPSLASLGQPVPDARLHHDFLTIVSLRLEECRYEYRHGRRDARSTLETELHDAFEIAGIARAAYAWKEVSCKNVKSSLPRRISPLAES